MEVQRIRLYPWVLRVAALLLGLAVFSACATVDPSIVPLALPSTAGAITGAVLSAGAPVAGAAVSTIPPTVNGATDSAGRFTLSPIPPQTVTVVVEPGNFLSQSKVVTVLPGATVNVTFTPQEATSATINGRVTDGVFGLPDAVVTTVPPTQRVTTTADGAFLFTGLNPGQYRIDADKPGFFPTSAFVTVSSGQVARVTVAATRRFDGAIFGVVTDGVAPVGTTTQVVRITLFAGERRQTLIRPEFVFQPRPAPSFPLPLNFNYTFDGLPGGTAVVQAEAPGFVPGIKEVRIEPPLVANGEIVLSRDGLTGAVAGTVFDPFGTPRPGSIVEVSQAANPPVSSTTTDAIGRYRFPGLPPGGFVISVRDTLFATGTLSVNVAPGGTADGSLRFVR